MKESVWGYWIIVFGLGILGIMLILQNYTTTNEQDVYLIKEITDAALGDSLDLAHYRKYGEIRIIKEKFVENFIRRFSETININKNYKISFYDIYEAPPKVSVKVATVTGTFNASAILFKVSTVGLPFTMLDKFTLLIPILSASSVIVMPFSLITSLILKSML